MQKIRKLVCMVKGVVDAGHEAASALPDLDQMCAAYEGAVGLSSMGYLMSLALALAARTKVFPSSRMGRMRFVPYASGTLRGVAKLSGDKVPT